MRNKKRKGIAKEGDKRNKEAGAKKKKKKTEGTRKLKIYRDRRARPDEKKRQAKQMR